MDLWISVRMCVVSLIAAGDMLRGIIVWGVVWCLELKSKELFKAGVLNGRTLHCMS